MFDPNTLQKYKAVTVPISTGSFDEHIAEFLRFGKAHISSYSCMVNVHMTVEASKDKAFKKIVENADLATADGMPVLRSLQVFHRIDQERVAGNDIMPAVMKAAEKEGLSVYFYGGSDENLQKIQGKAHIEYPDLVIAGAYSPPYRAISEEEENEIADKINASGAHIVLVSLGCPKQEKWMARMKGKINAMMLGVGGAFLLYIGVDRRAPKWMRDLSLEWTYRLFLEPKRLLKRYMVTNTTYIFLFFKTWMSRSYKV